MSGEDQEVIFTTTALVASQELPNFAINASLVDRSMLCLHE